MTGRPETIRNFSEQHLNLSAKDGVLAGLPWLVIGLGSRVFLGNQQWVEQSNLFHLVFGYSVVTLGIGVFRLIQSKNPEYFQGLDNIENNGINFIKESARSAVLQVTQLFRPHRIPS